MDPSQHAACAGPLPQTPNQAAAGAAPSRNVGRRLPLTSPEPLLAVRNLTTEFDTPDGVVRAVSGVSYDVYPGETLGVVGESGSGKSVTVLSVLGLIPSPPGRIAGGEVWFQGIDLLSLSNAELRTIRGRDIGMVFQDPMTSLNPVFTVGDQIAEAMLVHERIGEDEARRRTVALLKLVGVPNPDVRFDQYPHEYSGGMRQRAMIAMAIANQPKLLIADEPTTALDVTIQAQVLDVLEKEAKKRRESAQAYDEAGRPELAAKERAEAEIICCHYLF